jgi:hypothetical protein
VINADINKGVKPGLLIQRYLYQARIRNGLHLRSNNDWAIKRNVYNWISVEIFFPGDNDRWYHKGQKNLERTQEHVFVCALAQILGPFRAPKDHL